MLEAIEIARDLGILCFKLWDLRSGQLLRTSSFDPPKLLDKSWCFQGRFLLGIAEEDKEYILKVLDFGTSDAQDGELWNDNRGNLRDDGPSKPQEARKDDHEKPMALSAGSSAIEDESSTNSKPTSTKKRKKRSVQHGQNSPGRNWWEKYTKQGAGVELSGINALATQRQGFLSIFQQYLISSDVQCESLLARLRRFFLKEFYH